MKHSKKYVPTGLIKLIGKCLFKKDSGEQRKYPARYLKDHHLSARAQEHILHHPEALTIFQFYAAIRILLINSPSDWERILLLCRFLDLLEKSFTRCYGNVTVHPFSDLLEKTVRLKMQSVACYKFEEVITDVRKWRRS